MSTSIGSLIVTIGAETKGLILGVREAEGVLTKLSMVAAGTAGAILAIGTATAAVGLAMVKHSMAGIDAQSKLAYRLDATLGSVQALQYAGDVAGVSLESLGKSMAKLNVTLSSGKGDTALRNLHLQASELLKLDIADRVAAIADAMDRLNLTSGQQAVVLKQLGIRGQDIINLFEGGSKNIRDAQKDLKDFGGVLSTLDGIKIEQANDAWTRVGRMIKAAGDQLAVALSPFIKEAADQLVDVGNKAGGVGNVIRSMVRDGAVLFGYLLEKVYDLRVAFDDLGKLEIKFKVPEFFSWIPALTGMKEETVLFKSEWGKLKETLGRPPSKEEILAWFKEVSEKGEEAAQKILDARDEKKGRPGTKLDLQSNKEKEQLAEKLLNLRKSIATEDEALRYQRDKDLNELDELNKKMGMKAAESAQLRLDIEANYQKKKKELIEKTLEDSTLTEDEALRRKWDKQLKDLDTFERNQTITSDRASELRFKMEQKRTLDLTQLQAKQYSDLASIIDNAMSNIASIMADESKKGFTAMKAIAVATATVKGYEAAVSAWAAGEKTGIPGMGIVMAGVALAGTAAYIAKISGIAGRATGGAVKAGTPYWVGEMGRKELFVPSTDGAIVPENKVGGGAGGGMSITIGGPEINIAGDASENTVSLIRREMASHQQKLPEIILQTYQEAKSRRWI